MRFAGGPKITNFLGEKPNYAAQGAQATADAAENNANVAMNNARTADATMTGLAKVKAAEHWGSAQVAAAAAQGQASMVSGIAGGIGGLGGLFGSRGGGGGGGLGDPSGSNFGFSTGFSGANNYSFDPKTFESTMNIGSWY